MTTQTSFQEAFWNGLNHKSMEVAISNMENQSIRNIETCINETLTQATLTRNKIHEEQEKQPEISRAQAWLIYLRISSPTSSTPDPLPSYAKKSEHSFRLTKAVIEAPMMSYSLAKALNEQYSDATPKALCKQLISRIDNVATAIAATAITIAKIAQTIIYAIGALFTAFQVSSLNKKVESSAVQAVSELSLATFKTIGALSTSLSNKLILSSVNKVVK